MGKTNIVICFFGDNAEYLYKVFDVLHTHYKIENFSIKTIFTNHSVPFRKTDLNNISVEDISKSSFDYVIVAGFNPLSDCASLKKAFAEKIKIPVEAIIFDFELYSGKFKFPNACLISMFNHRFDNNLPLLRKIYGKRFSNIRFLMPFYNGSDSDVIPVYESSYQFQAYLIQAYEKIKDVPCSHYLFVADDLIINPDFNELNFLCRTNILDKKFLSIRFGPLNRPNSFRWGWTGHSSKPFYNAFTSYKNSLYTYDEAMSKFNDFFGVKYKEVYGDDFFGDPNQPGANLLGRWTDSAGFYRVQDLFMATNGNSLKIPYPMASIGGVGDIFCVKKESLFEFSRLCGIFSAMNMFAEIAIPTAAVLTFKRSEVAFFPDESFRMFWANDRITFENKYDKNFNRLYNEWDKKTYFVHPVKLSNWKMI